MGYREKEIMNRVIMEGATCGRLFRANSGRGWTGKVVTIDSKRLVLANPRPFHGLPTGFSDIFGFKTIEIMEDMIGDRIAQFVAFEIKTGKIKSTKEQQKFINMILNNGGIAKVIRE
jgi:hypothetical protein